MIAALLILLMMAVPAVQAQYQLTATVDRTSVAVGESVTLTITFNGAATGVPTPELPAMSNLQIESGPYMETKFEIINMRRSSMASYTYVLRAIGQGTATIGRSTVKYKGREYATNPIQLQVSASGRSASGGAGGEDVFIRVSADKREAYPGEQIVLTYKIFFAVQITNPEIMQLPRATGFWTEEFDMPQQMALRDEVVDGRSYKSGIFRKVAVFPTTSGELTIQPMVIRTKVETRTNRRSMTSDPFFRLNRSMETREIRSPSVNLNIKSLPESNQPPGYAGAVGNFTIRASLDRTECDAHDAVTLTVLLRGQGNIKTLPAPSIVFPPDFEYYEPKSDENIVRNGAKIEGTKKFEYVLIPRVSGTQEIPEIRYSYFNPESEQYVTASTPAIVLRVDHAKTAQTGEVSLPMGRKRGVESIANDIAFAKIQPGTFYRSKAMPHQSAAFWVYTLGPWLALAALAVARRRSGLFELGRMSVKRAAALAVKELDAAQKSCAANQLEDAYRRIAVSVQTCLSAKLNQDLGSLTTESIADLWRSQQLDEGMLTRILKMMDECDRSRFTAGRMDAADVNRLIHEARSIVSGIESLGGGKAS